MTLSIVILCWNDRGVIFDCLDSIIARTHSVDIEIIVSDNGSTDGSPEYIRQKYPQVIVIENGRNLRFAKGNNVGIAAAKGEFVLILNPDTIIHEGALDRLVEFARMHPEAGGFGCRVLNEDGSYQGPARPFPTVWRDWLAALYLRPLAYLSDFFTADKYVGWVGDTEREIDWQSGCCVMVRGELLKAIGGFDEQFYYYFEDVDLCHRVWKAGYSILYTPAATITHLGGRSVKSFKVAFELDKYRNRYRYFYKYFGKSGAQRSRWTVLAWLRVRQIGYGCINMVRRSPQLDQRLAMYRVVANWNRHLDPVAMVENGIEPNILVGEHAHVPQ